MANSNKLFEQFNREIRLDDTRREKLKYRRNSLRSRISDGFSKLDKVRMINEDLTIQIDEELEHQSQGSFVTDTIINPCRKEDEYDLDDGVYFIGSRPRNSRPNTGDFHQFIIESVQRGEGEFKYEEIIEKDTCVRVKYKGENGDFNYHIDIPIYYANDIKSPDLAHKKDSWMTSNPIEFIVWFEDLINSGFEARFILESRLYEDEYKKWLNDRRKKDHQLRKIVRYLKAWGDNLKGEMPPGIAMTILAASNSNYFEDERDDVSLTRTLENIEVWLNNNGFKCPRPTTPKGDDLFKNYPESRKDYLRKALRSFIKSARKALETDDLKMAADEWKKHLGDRFLKVNESLLKKENELKKIASSVLSGTALTDGHGRIQQSTGVKNQTHKNFGGGGGWRKHLAKSKRSNPITTIQKERSLLQVKFPFLESKIQNGVLYCYGTYQPTELSNKYTYRIKYDGIKSPSVNVVNPVIPYNDDIHMYPRNNSLCLYHKSDLKWDSSQHHVHELIVPWTHEWFVFFELYEFSGTWEHPFVSHKRGQKNE